MNTECQAMKCMVIETHVRVGHAWVGYPMQTPPVVVTYKRRRVVKEINVS